MNTLLRFIDHRGETPLRHHAGHMILGVVLVPCLPAELRDVEACSGCLDDIVKTMAVEAEQGHVEPVTRCGGCGGWRTAARICTTCHPLKEVTHV